MKCWLGLRGGRGWRKSQLHRLLHLRYTASTLSLARILYTHCAHMAVGFGHSVKTPMPNLCPRYCLQHLSLFLWTWQADSSVAAQLHYEWQSARPKWSMLHAASSGRPECASCHQNTAQHAAECKPISPIPPSHAYTAHIAKPQQVVGPREAFL